LRIGNVRLESKNRFAIEVVQLQVSDLELIGIATFRINSGGVGFAGFGLLVAGGRWSFDWRFGVLWWIRTGRWGGGLRGSS
jgi:hypothetical protein